MAKSKQSNGAAVADEKPAKRKTRTKGQDPHEPPKHLKDFGLESYIPQTVHRSLLKNAPYNPRHMTDIEARKLRRIIKKHGLVAGITWNKRSGNIVGGHQRLSQIDALMKTANYDLTVDVIDVDDSAEKEINIALNNPDAQGSWDLEKLHEMFQDPKLEIEGTGFEQVDVFRIFGTSAFDARGEDAEALAEKLRDIREKFDSIAGKTGKTRKDKSTDYFMVVVFRSQKDRDTFMREKGLPIHRYQSSDDIEGLVEKGKGK